MAIPDRIQGERPLDDRGQWPIFPSANGAQSIHQLDFQTHIDRLAFVPVVQSFSSHGSILPDFIAGNKKVLHGTKWTLKKNKKITCHGG
jgi:hypothetical protein